MAESDGRLKLEDIESIGSLRSRRCRTQSGKDDVNWKDMLAEPLYGRICNTPPGDDLPEKLSKRRTAFVFGPETICNALLTMRPYELLIRLGYSPQYIDLKVNQQNRAFWVLLFRQSVAANLPVVPASWSGVIEIVRLCYPLALEPIVNNLSSMKRHDCNYYEEIAGFKFMNALKDTSGPMFMSYEKFLSLERPQTPWQTRLFLYCELRLNELFSGDGYTRLEDGNRGEMEYMCPNFSLEQLGENNYTVYQLKQISVLRN